MSEELTLRMNKKYNKLEGVGDEATLLFASFINLTTPQLLLMYSELLSCDTMVGENRAMPLLNEYILCLFKGNCKLFTALKPNTEENIKKYFYNIGKKFKVSVAG